MPTRPVISYRGEHRFALRPEQLWEAIGRTDRFEQWWSWLRDFHQDGEGLAAGTVLRGAVVPPLPYRMAIEVRLVDCDPPRSIDAVVDGDLRGDARLELSPSAGGTTATTTWTVEMMQPQMRLASRLAHPLLVWGHDRVVEMTVSSFRRHAERLQPPPP